MSTSVEGVDDGAGFGLKGTATSGDGVVGTTRGLRKVGIRGIHTGHVNAIAIRGELGQGTAAVLGQTAGGSGVGDDDLINSGVWGDSSQGPGVTGTSSVAAGVLGFGPVAVRGVAQGGSVAGLFEGDLRVTGNAVVDGDVLLAGADLAEEFEVVGPREAEPGSVVVLAGVDRIRVSDEPYDQRVAGVISGAGNYRPAIVLDRRAGGSRRALALTGKAWCKVDADHGPIAVGDLLTTSPTPGHAMRAGQDAAAFGAVLGKALGSLDAGRALLPILVTLQ